MAVWQPRVAGRFYQLALGFAAAAAFRRSRPATGTATGAGVQSSTVPRPAADIRWF
jgi:hypothetical protein